MSSIHSVLYFDGLSEENDYLCLVDETLMYIFKDHF